MKAIARGILRLGGWKVDEVIPKEAQRSVMIAAPHTTNWDFIITRLAFYVLGIPMKVTIKDFWTKPPFGWFIVPLGGLGIHRVPKNHRNEVSYIDQMAAFFDTHERIAMVVSAEGTRARTTKWKTGFYHTAKKAGVPITFGYLDYKTKTAGVGAPVLYLTEDMNKDMKMVMDFYKNIHPKYPEKFSLDERFV